MDRLAPFYRRLARARHGALELVGPDGRRRRFEGVVPGPAATWNIRRARVMRRMLMGGAVGFAEAYMDGDWDSPDLTALLEWGEANRDALGALDSGGVLARALRWLRHAWRKNDRRGSRRNIASHYDLGNDFYSLWLDETMTYSSAVWPRPSASLAEAQHAKYARMLALVAPRPGDHLLEIGSGWGGFAIHAARTTGCRVTSVTLSHEQLAEARRRAAAAGVADRVEFRLQDYRDLDGVFDGIVSIEMFEAVGEAYWPTYFDVISKRLAPGRRAAVQVITIRDDLYDDYRQDVDFIQRYIFPGGMLPSPSRFAEHARRAGLHVGPRSFHGLDYARTLEEWERRFRAVDAQVRTLGFDDHFMRMWHYYLAYCQAGFRRGTVDLMQVALQ